MKDFELVLPETLEQAIASLPSGKDASWDQARILAGGQDLLPELKDYVASAERLVNFKRVPDLRGIEFESVHDTRGRMVSIGALTRIADLEDAKELPPELTILREAAASIGSPQIRSLGTVGGNLCQRPRCWYYRNEHTVCLKKGGEECFSYGGRNRYNAILGGGPSYIVHPSDLAPALLALGGWVTIQGPDGDRNPKLEEFFTLPSEGDVTRENVLAPNEIVTHVHVPPHEGWKGTYLKFRERGSFDFALASVALMLRMDGEEIAQAGLALGGAAPIPWRNEEAEALLVGRRNDDEAAHAAADLILAEAEPLGENGYKVPLVRGLIVKAMRKLRAS